MHIANPCHEDWNRMSPNEQGRHCASCDKTVVDLTALSVPVRRERMAGISQELRQGKRVCVRGRVDRDGALAGSRRTLTGGMALILAMTIAGCQGDGPQVVSQPQTQQQTQSAPLPGEAMPEPQPQPKVDPKIEPQPPMGIMAPVGQLVAPQPQEHVLRGDVAEHVPVKPVVEAVPTKMGEMVCPAPVTAVAPPVPAPEPAPAMMGKIAAPPAR